MPGKKNLGGLRIERGRRKKSGAEKALKTEPDPTKGGRGSTKGGD